MEKKRCELCESTARMYCKSDQAHLCWDCDYKVHSANFLVARHSRTLLCQACQSPTPWSAAGAKLGPTVSLCNHCSSSEDAAAASPSDDRESFTDGEDLDLDDDDDDVA